MNARLLIQRLNITDMDLHCQAQLNMADGSLSGMELLLRATRGKSALAPLDIVEQASRTGLGRELALWTLERAGEIESDFRKAGMASIVRVNLMEAEIATAGFVEEILPLIEGHSIEIELVECWRMADFRPVAEGLAHLAEKNVKVWLDDFAQTREDTQRILTPGAFHGVKIDRTILAAAPTHGIAGLVELSEGLSALGLEVLVEGVESLQDMVRVGGTCARIAQGYYLHRPESCAATIETFRMRDDRFRNKTA